MRKVWQPSPTGQPTTQGVCHCVRVSVSMGYFVSWGGCYRPGVSLTEDSLIRHSACLSSTGAKVSEAWIKGACSGQVSSPPLHAQGGKEMVMMVDRQLLLYYGVPLRHQWTHLAMYTSQTLLITRSEWLGHQCHWLMACNLRHNLHCN